MHVLTREIRMGFAPDGSPADEADRGGNGHSASPALTGLGVQVALRVSLRGQLESGSQYVRNIKDIDSAARGRAVALLADTLRRGAWQKTGQLAGMLFDALRDSWPGSELDRLELLLSPWLAVSIAAREYPMVRLSQRFEFFAAHRLHNPALSDDQNVATFGKCNNAAGHGHNYELAVEVVGEVGAAGVLIAVLELERIVQQHVIEPFDHKHLNTQTAEFASVIPSVENIARVIFDKLNAPLRRGHCRLGAVTVWETPRTWCRYGD